MKSSKLPLIESVYRWIDLYTFFNYPDEIRNTAYNYAIINQSKLGRPHVSAATAVMLACGSYGTEFNFSQIADITVVHRSATNVEPGIWFESLKRTGSKWIS
jgi:hypothetical protein